MSTSLDTHISDKIRSPMGRPFRLEISAVAGRRYVPFLRTHLRRLHAWIKSAPLEVSLALVGDRDMSALHQRFMHMRGPTDVLSFPLETDARGRTSSGEIVICVPEAFRRAREARTAVRGELLLYALHGLLHLSGFDDRTVADFNKMHRMEDRLLAKLGIGPVFAPPTRPIARRRSASGG